MENNFDITAILETIDEEKYNCLTPEELAFAMSTDEYQEDYIPDRFDDSVGCHYDEAFLCDLSDEDLAMHIREISEWDADLCRELCYRADLLDQYVYLQNWVPVVYEAAEKLGVNIDGALSDDELAAKVRETRDKDLCRALCFRADMQDEEYLEEWDNAEDDEEREDALRDAAKELGVNI